MKLSRFVDTVVNVVQRLQRGRQENGILKRRKVFFETVFVNQAVGTNRCRINGQGVCKVQGGVGPGSFFSGFLLFVFLAPVFKKLAVSF